MAFIISQEKMEILTDGNFLPFEITDPLDYLEEATVKNAACMWCDGSCSGDCQGGCSGDCSGSSR